MKLTNLQEYTDLKFYPALKTTADIQHGIDQFAVYKTKDGQRLLLTIDYSKSMKDSYHADILVTEQGAHLNPLVFPFAAQRNFVVKAGEQHPEAKHQECVARAMIAAFEMKADYRKSHPIAHSDGHYEIYPLEQSILINEKAQTESVRRVAGGAFLTEQRLKMLMEDDEWEDERDRKRKQSQENKKRRYS